MEAHICPHTKQLCYDPQCGQTENYCNNSHCFPPSEASEQKAPEPNDVAYTMHQLQMLINFLDQKGIGVKWNGEYWVDSQEQKPVVTQSEKGETAKNLEFIKQQMDTPRYELHPAWSEDEYILVSTLWKIFKANTGTNGKKMAVDELRKNYSLLERSRAREGAIQECIDSLNKFNESPINYVSKNAIVELEKLKSRQ